MKNYSNSKRLIEKYQDALLSELVIDNEGIQTGDNAEKEFVENKQSDSNWCLFKHYNKLVLFYNIRNISKKKNIKLGDIEKEAGVAPGYMSRLDKDFRSADPSLEFVCTAAKMLDTSIDSLLNSNLLKLSPNEEYIMNFINNLITKTESGILPWNIEKAEYLNRLSESAKGTHILFVPDEFNDYQARRSMQETKMIFKSASFGKNTLICGDGFNLELPNSCRIYIMKIASSVSKSDQEIELWMYNSNNYKKKLLISTANENLRDKIFMLYETVSKNAQRPTIDKDFKISIDAFMEK